jgi:hypothetical protein
MRSSPSKKRVQKPKTAVDILKKCLNSVKCGCHSPFESHAKRGGKRVLSEDSVGSLREEDGVLMSDGISTMQED